ncbi:LOW QUALITY PROTEIN: hypothetical protein TMDG_04083, partial [Mycobacterium tuberculosis SUMu004]
MEGRFDDHHAL